MSKNPMMPGGPPPRLSPRKIISAVPIEIHIMYDETNGRAVCNITRGGKMFEELTALELVVIFSNLQVGYIQAGLGNVAGLPPGNTPERGGDNGAA